MPPLVEGPSVTDASGIRCYLSLRKHSVILASPRPVSCQPTRRAPIVRRVWSTRALTEQLTRLASTLLVAQRKEADMADERNPIPGKREDSTRDPDDDVIGSADDEFEDADEDMDDEDEGEDITDE
jgi:hypothetical protein